MEIEVRSLQPTDFDGYWPLISNPKLADAAGFWAAEDKFAGQMMFQAALRRQLTYLVIYKQQIVGSVAFETDGTNTHRFEIGYVLLADFWNLGIMTAAVGQATKLAVEDLLCQELWAKVATVDSASAKVLQKNGFKPQGVSQLDGTVKFIWQG